MRARPIGMWFEAAKSDADFATIFARKNRLSNVVRREGAGICVKFRNGFCVRNRRGICVKFRDPAAPIGPIHPYHLDMNSRRNRFGA